MSNLVIDRQVATQGDDLPDQTQLELWVATTLTHISSQENGHAPCELTIRLVDAEESQALNSQYRGRDYPTNVLSFPFDAEIELPVQLLGDLVICVPVVQQEATEQGKSSMAHWTHMVVHGTLHLLGYDHIEDSEAEEMEALERLILAELDIADPYLDNAP